MKWTRVARPDCLSSTTSGDLIKVCNRSLTRGYQVSVSEYQEFVWRHLGHIRAIADHETPKSYDPPYNSEASACAPQLFSDLI